MFPGKGLTVCVSVIRGDYTRGVGEAMAAKQSLRRTMDEERVKGFVDVLVARNVTDGLSHLYVSSRVSVNPSVMLGFQFQLLGRTEKFHI